VPRRVLLVTWGIGAILATALRLVGDEGPSRGAPPLHPEVNEEAVLARFLARPDESHLRLRGLRHFRAEGLGKQAFMDVQVWLEAEEGLRFRVEAEGGSRLLRDSVFHNMLQQEQDAYASGTAARSAFTADNYALSADGWEPSGLVRLRAVPRRSEAALLDGRFLVTSDTADLVRAEGVLARAPSFWVPRVAVVRHYRRIRGQRLQVRLESVAQLRLCGEVRVVVDFDYQMVDGVELGGVDS